MADGARSLSAATACWSAPRSETAALTASGETVELSFVGFGVRSSPVTEIWISPIGVIGVFEFGEAVAANGFT
jgi:hypothetical protein